EGEGGGMRRGGEGGAGGGRGGKRANARRRGVCVSGVVVICGPGGLAPAAPTKIRVDAETFPWANLSGYRTYRWWKLPISDQRARGYGEQEALLDWRVRQAVDRDLTARGYSVDTAGTPDFVVRYNVQLQEGSTSSFREYLSYRTEGGGKDMGDAFMGYERGMLTLEVVDVASRRIAWRAAASAIIEGDGNGKLIDPAVRQMLERFPAAPR